MTLRQAQGAPDLRKRMIAKIHVAKAKLGLDDVAYRAMLEAETGKKSSKNMAAAELERVLGRLKTLGFRDRLPRAQEHAGSAQHVKVRALWHSLWLLGAVDHADDRALDSWIAGTAGVSALRFAAPVQANKAIEGLKAMCARHGYAVPDRERVDALNAARRNAALPPARYGHVADVVLVQALWDRLIAAGVMRTGIHARIDSWMNHQGWGVADPAYLDENQARLAAERLGAWLRDATKTDS
jgi:hypothetical protein